MVGGFLEYSLIKNDQGSRCTSKTHNIGFQHKLSSSVMAISSPGNHLEKRKTGRLFCVEVCTQRYGWLSGAFFYWPHFLCHFLHHSPLATNVPYHYSIPPHHSFLFGPSILPAAHSNSMG
ncbi:UNVERIFIED_CONTAM: hypothetical protein K2H54_060257 [Gekko kuhli]